MEPTTEQGKPKYSSNTTVFRCLHAT